MAEAKRTATVACPVCGRDLPPVPIRLTSQRWEAAWSVIVNVEPAIDDAWRQAVADTHPDCVRG